MSDNSDDFETEDFDLDGFDDGGFDDMDDQKGTLGDIWRNNPIVKIAVIAVGALVLIFGIIMFGGKAEEPVTSRVAGAKDLTEAPGTSEVSATYREAVEEENVRRTEESVRNQGSAIPTPIDPPKGTIDIQIDDPEEEDPLERWRRMQEERIRNQQIEQQPEQVQPEPEPVDTKTPAVNALSAAMSQQMGSILGTQDLNSPIVRSVASVDFLQRQQEEAQARLAEAAGASGQSEVITDDNDLNIILPAGTIEYAQLLTEANTDAPGPILAQIVSGPLRGARMIGSFRAQRKYLTLNFNTIVLDGVDFSADGIAIDPETTLPGVITDINNRYFQRIILPAAAEFVEGLTEAIADSGTTTITIDGDTSTQTTSNTNTDSDQEIASGIEQAGEELGEIFDEIADDIEPMLRVRAGTPIGVLFVSPVIGTPQIIEQREADERERERLLRLPENVNLIPSQLNTSSQ
jgi:intracellular multiplication protein IcmE